MNPDSYAVHSESFPFPYIASPRYPAHGAHSRLGDARAHGSHQLVMSSSSSSSSGHKKVKEKKHKHKKEKKEKKHKHKHKHEHKHKHKRSDKEHRRDRKRSRSCSESERSRSASPRPGRSPSPEPEAKRHRGGVDSPSRVEPMPLPPPKPLREEVPQPARAPARAQARHSYQTDVGGKEGAWLAEHDVRISPGCPPPVLDFDDAPLPASVRREISAAKFASPSLIQCAAWPPAFAGMDVIGVAKTGSGKTLAFLAPAFLQIEQERTGSSVPHGVGPRALVLAPTRELAIQIRDESAKFGRSSGITSCVVYGGAPRGGQLAELKRNPQVVVATPGRLNDFLEFRQVRLRLAPPPPRALP